MEGLVKDMNHCLHCGSSIVEKHHVFFGTANRKQSDKYGLIVPLCPEHHRGTFSPHRNRAIDLALKEKAQAYFEEHYGNRDDFRRIFGKSYL